MSGGLGSLDVGVSIADNERTLAVDRPSGEKIINHARSRFPPVRDPAILFDRGFGMKWAVADVIDTSTDRGQFPAHPVVEAIDRCFVVIAMRHTCLVGDDERVVARVVDEADCLERPRLPTPVGWTMDVVRVLVENAVAVEENGGPSKSCRHSKVCRFEASGTPMSMKKPPKRRALGRPQRARTGMTSRSNEAPGSMSFNISRRTA